MGGYTKLEKKYKTQCGYANYKEFREDFNDLLDAEFGSHISLKMKPTKMKYCKRWVDTDIITVDHIKGESNGRRLWDLFKDNRGIVHNLEDDLCCALEFQKINKKRGYHE